MTSGRRYFSALIRISYANRVGKAIHSLLHFTRSKQPELASAGADYAHGTDCGESADLAELNAEAGFQRNQGSGRQGESGMFGPRHRWLFTLGFVLLLLPCG